MDSYWYLTSCKSPSHSINVEPLSILSVGSKFLTVSTFVCQEVKPLRLLGSDILFQWQNDLSWTLRAYLRDAKKQLQQQGEGRERRKCYIWHIISEDSKRWRRILKLELHLLRLPNALRGITSWTLGVTPLVMNTPFQACEPEINYHFNKEGSLIDLFLKTHAVSGDVMNCQRPLMMNLWIINTSSSALPLLKTQTKPQQRNSGHPGHCLWLQNKHYVLLQGSASALRWGCSGGWGGWKQTVGKQERRVWNPLPLDFVTQLPQPQVFLVLKTSRPTLQLTEFIWSTGEFLSSKRAN